MRHGASRNATHSTLKTPDEVWHTNWIQASENGENYEVQWTYAPIQDFCGPIAISSCSLEFEVLALSNGVNVATFPAPVEFHGSDVLQKGDLLIPKRDINASNSTLEFKVWLNRSDINYAQKQSHGYECPRNNSCYPWIIFNSSSSNTLNIPPNAVVKDLNSFDDYSTLLLLITMAAIIAGFVVRPLAQRYFSKSKDYEPAMDVESGHSNGGGENDNSRPQVDCLVEPKVHKKWFSSNHFFTRAGKDSDRLKSISISNKVVQYNQRDKREDIAPTQKPSTNQVPDKTKILYRETDILRRALNEEESKAAAQLLTSRSADGFAFQLLHKTKKTLGKSTRFFMDGNLLTLSWGVASRGGGRGGSRSMHFVDIRGIFTWTNQLPPAYNDRYSYLLHEPFFGVLITYVHATKRDKEKEIFLKCKTLEKQQQVVASIRKLHAQAMDRLNNIVILDDVDSDDEDESVEQKVDMAQDGFEKTEEVKEIPVETEVKENLADAEVKEQEDEVDETKPLLEIPIVKSDPEVSASEGSTDENGVKKRGRSPREKAQSAKKWMNSKRVSAFLARASATEEKSPHVAMQVKLYSGEYNPEVENVAKTILEVNKKHHIEEKSKRRGSSLEADIQKVGLTDNEKESAAHQALVAQLVDGHNMHLLHKTKMTLGKMTRFFIDDSLMTLKWGLTAKPKLFTRGGTHTLHLVDVLEVTPWTNNLPQEYSQKYKAVLESPPFFGVMVKYTHATKRNKPKDIFLQVKDADDQKYIIASLNRLSESAKRRQSKQEL